MNKTYEQFESTITELLRLQDKEVSLLTDPINEGKWSIREIIAHLYYWDKFILEEMVPQMEQGATLSEFPDHDTYNEKAITQLKDHSVEAIIELFVDTRKRLIESLMNIGDDVRFTIGNEKREFTAESFTKMFVEHDVHHLKQISGKVEA